MPNGTAYEFPEAGPAGVSAVVVEKAKADALAIPDRIGTLVIRDQESLDIFNGLLIEVDARLEYFSDLYDPQIAKANALHKSLLADKKKLTDPLERAKKAGRAKVADYLYEEDQKRLAAARERQLAEEKAEREAEKAVDKAHELIEKGQDAKAESIIDKATEKIEAIKAAAPAVPEKPVADFSLRETWEFEVTDASLVPRKYLLVDEVTIGKIVRAMKDQTDIPGIRAYPKRSVASKAGKY
jgi:hypothetical protein